MAKAVLDMSAGWINVGWRYAVLVALLPVLIVLLPGCNEDSVERQIGSATAASVEATYRVNRDPLLNDWNQQMGRTLTAFSVRQQVPYQFKVVDTDMVNAFAAPWGYVYVTQGFLDFADSEDEVVAVVGHEIGHVVHRDGIRGFKQNLLFNLAAGLISSKSETLGGISAIGLGLLSLHYSREQEYKADDTGTALAYAAGYDPQGLLSFFTKLHTDLEKERRSSYLGNLLSTHPYTPSRRDRQAAQPWVMGTTAPSAMRIAQGYLARGQYQRALALLNAQAAKEPDNQQLALMIADALAGSGAQEAARGQYQMASTQGSASYANYALAQIERNPVPASVPPTGDEQGQALAAVPGAQALVRQTQTTSAQLAGVRQSMAGTLQAARGDSAAAREVLQRLADVEADLPKQTQTIAVDANAAVAAAAEVVYTLDRCQEQSEAAVQNNAAVAQQAAELLQSLAQGGSRAGALRLVQSAVHELEKSNELLVAAGAAARAAVGPAQQAQLSARQTTMYVERLFDQRRVRQSDLTLARMMTQETTQKAQAAAKQSQEAQDQARLATVRGTLAVVQMAHAAAPAEMLPGLDRMVAHYLRTNVGQIATLREQGFGYGDIAVIVTAARATGSAVGLEATRLGTGVAPLDVVDLKVDGTNGLKVMAKFLSRAMTQELALMGRTEAPTLG